MLHPDGRHPDALLDGGLQPGALSVALAQGAGLEAAVEEGVRVASIRVQHIGPRSWLEYVPCA